MTEQCIIIFDAKTMYPSIVIGENICSSTKEVSEVMGERVVKFNKDKIGLMPKVIQLSIDAREEYRRLRMDADEKGLTELAKKYRGMEKSAKVAANATYGVMLYKGFRLFDKDCADAVTRTGRRIIRRLYAQCLKENLPNEELKAIIAQVLYGDTDSIFILLNCKWNNMKKILKVSDYLNGELKKLCQERGYESADIEGKVEAVFDRIIFKYRVAKKEERAHADNIGGKMVVGAKKRYAGRLRWKEGRGECSEHYIKGFGRSDISRYTKRIYELVWSALLDDGDVDKAIQVLREGWLGIQRESWYELSIPRGVRGNFKEYKEDSLKGGHIGATLYMIENCHIKYNPMIKPRAVCVKPKMMGGKERKLPDTKRIVLLNGMKEPPASIIREFEVDYHEQAKALLTNPFELLVISLGRQWTEVVTGTAQTSLSKFFDEHTVKEERRQQLDDRLEDEFEALLTQKSKT